MFYSGGELSPLPELHCQKDSALERVQYVAEVNRLKRAFSGLSVEQKDTWEDLQMHGNPVMSDQGQKENCYAFDASIQSCYVSQ